MDPAGAPALQEAIQHLHGCASELIESLPVKEAFQGKVVWDGDVQVFRLKGARFTRPIIATELTSVSTTARWAEAKWTKRRCVLSSRKPSPTSQRGHRASDLGRPEYGYGHVGDVPAVHPGGAVDLASIRGARRDKTPHHR